MKKQGPTHSPEHVHSFTFHFFCLSCENLRFENGRKLRSGFGGEEILPHLREIGHVLYMVRTVSSCLTSFVLEVCSKNQRIRISNKACRRAFFGSEVEEEVVWAGPGFLFF